MTSADWAYTGSDQALSLFGAVLQASGRAVTGRVLEIGCAEADWLSLAQAADPSLDLYGIDWRRCPRPGTITHGDVRLPTQYAPASFDTIVSLGAIEHVGLGHYSEDPLDPDGDRVAIQNAWNWLTPGGWLYFDVPYHRDNFQVYGTEYRVYNDDALYDRLLMSRAAHWADTRTWFASRTAPGTLVDPPLPGSVPEGFSHYVAVWAQRV